MEFHGFTDLHGYGYPLGPTPCQTFTPGYSSPPRGVQGGQRRPKKALEAKALEEVGFPRSWKALGHLPRLPGSAVRPGPGYPTDAAQVHTPRPSRPARPPGPGPSKPTPTLPPSHARPLGSDGAHPGPPRSLQARGHARASCLTSSLRGTAGGARASSRQHTRPCTAVETAAEEARPSRAAKPRGLRYSYSRASKPTARSPAPRPPLAPEKLQPGPSPAPPSKLLDAVGRCCHLSMHLPIRPLGLFFVEYSDWPGVGQEVVVGWARGKEAGRRGIGNSGRAPPGVRPAWQAFPRRVSLVP